MLLLMFPTHLAVGYLIGGYTRYPILPVVAGSTMPDLVDRPLYWIGLTPLPHTFAHSLFVAVPVSLVLIWRFGLPGLGFAIGWLIHIFTDVLNVLTTQGPDIAPYYALFPLSRPENGEMFVTVTISLPVTDITHTVNPVIIAIELVLIAWAMVVLGRRREEVPALRS